MIRFRYYNTLKEYNLLEFDCYRHHESHPYKAVTVSIRIGRFGLDVISVYRNRAAYKQAEEESK